MAVSRKMIEDLVGVVRPHIEKLQPAEARVARAVIDRMANEKTRFTERELMGLNIARNQLIHLGVITKADAVTDPGIDAAAGGGDVGGGSKKPAGK